jgi:hypothetical protein
VKVRSGALFMMPALLLTDAFRRFATSFSAVANLLNPEGKIPLHLYRILMQAP